MQSKDEAPSSREDDPSLFIKPVFMELSFCILRRGCLQRLVLIMRHDRSDFNERPELAPFHNTLQIRFSPFANYGIINEALVQDSLGIRPYVRPQCEI